MSGKPLDKYTDTTTPVSTSVQGCGMVEVKHEVYYPDDLGQRIPAANVPYRLQIPHGGNIFGTTDANGVLRFEGTGEGTFHCEYEPTLHIEKDQILNEIRTALDELLKVERDETAKIIKQLDEQPWYADAADYGMAAVRGVWNGIVGIVEFVGTVLWGAAKGLYHASKYLNPLTAPETFKQDMAALKETYQELKEFKDEDLETYLMLANDEETWKLFTKFAEDYVDAQHSLEWTEGGGETVFAIILIVVTAGAGAAGAAGSAGSRLAQLGQKLSGPIKRLTDVLKRARAKKKVKDKTNQRVESEAEIKDNKTTYEGKTTKKTPIFTNKARMDPDYIGEETGAVWGTKVKYLDEVERQEYKLHIKDGKLYDAKGKLFDTTKSSTFGGNGKGKAIFVMDEYGSIYASKVHKTGKFHHSSFLSGQPVASAGELVVKNGTPKAVTRRSGHYEPTAEQLDQFIEQLGKNKVNLNNIDIGAGF